MTPEEHQDLEAARLRLLRAVTLLCDLDEEPGELIRTEGPRPEKVRDLVDECRQVLGVIVLIAGPEDSLERSAIRNTVAQLTNIPLWTTKDGTKIPVTKMTDTHLANTIVMLKRKREAGEEDIAATYGVLGSFDPDGMASYYGAHSVADDEERLARVSGWIAALEKEQQRRASATSCAVCPPGDPQKPEPRRCFEDGCPEPCIPEHQRCREHAATDWERYPPAGPVYARRIRAGENPFAKPWQEDL